MNLEQLTERKDIVWEFTITYLPPILKALIVLLVGLKLIKRANKLTQMGLNKSHIDTTIRKFVASLVSIGLKILLLLSVASMLGIQTTSFVALIGAAGLAVGLSLQGSLANFAGGVLILLFKPYKVGDYIETEDTFGYVEEIAVFTTRMRTLENKIAIIPNGPIANGKIINWSKTGSVRVDVPVGIAYNANLKKAKEVLLGLAKAHTQTLDSREPQVLVSELADSSVNLLIRAYTKPENYRSTYFTLMEEAKLALDNAQIEIPFPQRVVHMASS